MAATAPSREADPLISTEPASNRRMIIKLALLSLISGGNMGYSLNIVGFVLKRLEGELVEEWAYGLVGAIAYVGLVIGCPLGAGSHAPSAAVQRRSSERASSWPPSS